ncbi:hypothetical protein WUBG_07816 [Wuchereria bancrofti]|uniref:Sugar phosphate transporter domain-containing protein n=1 Tax=Wuchereria bancrofti TaxID=6293 RepID=J9F1P4_WUCBA|nr:hypothetical protein WUBG_07816 [Wuchereria bancrofti]
MYRVEMDSFTNHYARRGKIAEASTGYGCVRTTVDVSCHSSSFFMYEGSQLSFDKVTHYRNEHAPFYVLFFISFGGLLAFAMEMAEYLLLVYTSGITLNIFGIIKEVVTLSLAHFINGDYFSLVNTVGLLLCFSGMLLHAFSKRTLLKARTKSRMPDRRRLLTDVDA